MKARWSRLHLLVGWLLAASGTLAAPHSEPSDPEPTLSLQRMMRAQAERMAALAGAIAREDWPAVRLTADQLAAPVQPPLREKLRILGFVGGDAPRYKQYHRRTAVRAAELAQAARSGDGPAVITAYAAVQRACLDCHRDFRIPFRRHFHPAPPVP